MLYTKTRKQFATYQMEVIEVSTRSPYTTNVLLKDDIGEVKASFFLSKSLVDNALGIPNENGVGRIVDVWLNVNCIPMSIAPLQELE